MAVDFIKMEAEAAGFLVRSKKRKRGSMKT
jgi:hypothetical protein